ncbi:MAG TPA: hypothetical protein VFL83_20540 [Anaeromyxobacter sp.]|nr:hypothetical protein [Anaeromyxobacter sp.]
MFRKILWSAVLALSAAGCGGMESRSVSAPLVVDDRGARIETETRMGRLDIPKGALLEPVEIRLVEVFDDRGRHEIEIEPAEVRFAKPAKLTFKLTDDIVPEREHAVEVEIQNEVEVEIEIERQVCDVVEQEIEAEVNHAGRFRREDRPL